MRILALGAISGGIGHAGYAPGVTLTPAQRSDSTSFLDEITAREAELDAKINELADLLQVASTHDVPRELLDAWDAELGAHIDTLFTLQNAELGAIDVRSNTADPASHWGRLDALDRVLDEMRANIEQRVSPSITARNWKVAIAALAGTAVVGGGLWWLYNRKPRRRS